VPFIVEATGKVVIPQQDVLSRRVTVLNDREIPRAEALDMVLLALQQAGVGVIETETIVTLRDINEVVRQRVPVIGPDESTMGWTNLGAVAEKVYRLRNVTAEAYADVLKNAIPDYAKLTVDKESNQVAILGPIALLQRMEALIRSLDQPSAGAMVAETFRLRFADAEQIARNIEELFGGRVDAVGPGVAAASAATRGPGGLLRPATAATATAGADGADPRVVEHAAELGDRGGGPRGAGADPLPDRAVLGPAPAR
jgi:Bacterial type II/III secretion system short domain.